MAWWLSCCLAAGALMLSAPGRAQERVSVPSLDLQHGAAVLLAGYWFPAPVDAEGDARPAVLMLHGCGGVYDRRGRLTSRMRDYAALLNAQGWHVLVLDSLRPRGITELCTRRAAERTVTMTKRRRDALGALQWLAQHDGVDPQRLVLLGWSNGGSVVLAATNRRVGEVAAAPVMARAAVAFYPGCEAELRRGYQAVTPLLMLVGGSDDWTPAQPCRDLAAAAAPDSPVQLVAYAGAYHGFDGEGPVRLRLDVPRGARPGQGVHVGGHPVARDASRERLLAFLREELMR